MTDELLNRVRRLTAVAAAAVLVAGVSTAVLWTPEDGGGTVAVGGGSVPRPSTGRDGGGLPADPLAGIDGIDNPSGVDTTTRSLPPTTAPALAAPQTTQRAPASALRPRPASGSTLSASVVSVSTDGGVGNGHSLSPSATSDGRLVVFVSYARDLVAGDTNGLADVFVRDTAAGKTTRIVAPGGAEPDADATWAGIAADGSRVVFASRASNLVADDTNGLVDLFSYDVGSGAVSRVYTATDPSLRNPVLSADGSTVAFDTRAGVMAGRVGEQPEVVNQHGALASLSADGRYVAFNSSYRGLVPGDEMANQDVYVYDRHTRTLELASGGADGSQPNAGSFAGQRALSADGRRVAFLSVAGLVPADTNGNADVYVRDLGTGRTLLVPPEGSGGNNASYHPAIAADGQSVGYTRPERHPQALRWSLAGNTVGALGPTTTHGLYGLQLVGAGYVAASSDAGLVGSDSRWASQQIVLIR